MQLLESGEMYLETILILSKREKPVRSIDIGEYMNYSKPSVSRAMSRLKSYGYVVTDSDGYITLTDSGKAVAEKIYERHFILTKFLRKIGVSEQTAAEDACKMEHDISDETFSAIKEYTEQSD